MSKKNLLVWEGRKYGKNDELPVVIDDIGTEGEGIGHVDGYALFIKNALPGEKVWVRLMKLGRNYGFARLLSILEPAPERQEPFCPVFGKCGGCSLQHLSYKAQLAYKEKKVRDCLMRIGGVDMDKVDFLGILGIDFPISCQETGGNETTSGKAENTGIRKKDEQKYSYFYRNKAQFPIRKDAGGHIVAGFFAGRSHRVIPASHCAIQHPVINQVLLSVVSFMEKYDVEPYEESTHSGLVRHLYVRFGYHTGQIMVCLVINGNSIPHALALIESLREIPGMSSISLNVNCERTNVILGKEMIPLWGPLFIEDRIGNVRFRISPQSFYQVNPAQTEKLYETVLDFADLHGYENVWDLYCGIGTISLFLARRAGYVCGVEIVPHAVENARENARLNGIGNVKFFCGAAEDIVGHMSPPFQKIMPGGKGADLVVVDPPRKGCDPALLDTMAAMNPQRIVYVSCDPATLARDVKRLGEKGYVVRKVQAVDMFGFSGHVETIVGLHRRDT